jgi:beta-lactamase regulating signal transducer with metallopeptidase domain
MASGIVESGSALFLASVLLKGSVLLTCAAVATLFLRRASAAARHLVWSAAVVSALVLPVGALLLQSARFELNVPVYVSAPAETTDMTALETSFAAPPQSSAAPATVVESASAAAIVAPATNTFAETQQAASAPRLPIDWTKLALIVWLSGAIVALIALFASTLRVLRMQRLSTPVHSGPLVELIAQLARRLNLARAPRLHMGDAHAMPMVWGLFRPVLLLPSGAVKWPQSRLQAVILHELAHVRRRDALTQLLAELARALYWCNPLVWLAARQLYLERELACDDIVLNAGTRPSEYAGELLDLVRTMRSTRATALAAIAMARPSQLKARLHAVLDEARSHRTLSRVFATTTAVLAVLLMLPLAALQPLVRAAVSADVPILPLSRSELTTLRTPEAPVAARPAKQNRVETGVTANLTLPAVQADVQPARQLNPRVQMSSSIVLPAIAARQQAVAPPAQQDYCGTVRGRGSNISHNSDDGVETIRWSRGRCSGSARIEGTVRFTDGFDDVLSLTSGGLFRLEEDDGDDERRVEVRSVRGELQYRYRVNGRDTDFDAAGRTWLRRALPGDAGAHYGFCRRSARGAAAARARCRWRAGRSRGHPQRLRPRCVSAAHARACRPYSRAGQSLGRPGRPRDRIGLRAGAGADRAGGQAPVQ